MSGRARKEDGRRAPVAPSASCQVTPTTQSVPVGPVDEKLKFIQKSFDSATVARKVMEDLDSQPSDKTAESHVFKGFKRPTVAVAHDLTEWN